MRSLYLQRHEDVNNTSGTGRVWEGVEFSNGWVAGKWNTPTTSYGWYPSVEHLELIHGHEGKTSVVVQDSLDGERKKRFLWLAAKNIEEVVGSRSLVAEGIVLPCGAIALLYFAKWTSVYWYCNIDDLKLVTGKRSDVRMAIADNYKIARNNSIWRREKIFV